MHDIHIQYAIAIKNFYHKIFLLFMIEMLCRISPIINKFSINQINQIVKAYSEMIFVLKYN